MDRIVTHPDKSKSAETACAKTCKELAQIGTRHMSHESQIGADDLQLELVPLEVAAPQIYVCMGPHG